MYDFIQIVTTGKLGNLTAQEWESVYSEYTEMSGSSSTNKSLDLAIQITYLTNRINIIQSLVQRLYMRRNDEVIALLVEMGMFFSYDDLNADLDRVLIKLKGEELLLNMANAEYKELGLNEGEKATEFDWYNILSELAKFQGYAVNPKQTTVTEYCALEKRFRAHIDYMNKQQRNYA